MSRKWYIILSVTPFALLATATIGFIDLQSKGSLFSFLAILFIYLPIIAVKRMKYLNYTKRQMIISFIPVWGTYLSRRRFLEK